MKTWVRVSCACGTVWADDNTPEAAARQWQTLEVLDPALAAKADERGLERTVERALRILWARHSIFSRECCGYPHNNVRITTEITIEDLDDLTATALPSRQEKE